MKKALVLGISGTFGSHVAQALVAKGWQIKAMVRHPEKMSTTSGIEFVKGDAANYDDVYNAANDVDLIVYGVNPANYDWEDKALPWLDVTARVAEERKLCIVFPGNVYIFDPSKTSTINEASAQSPIRRKGQIRQQMEQRLKHASENGAQVIIFRMGDFIAPNAKNSWITHVISNGKNKISISAPGNANLKHSWAYAPDCAKAIAQLCESLPQLESFNVFHFKGYQISVNDIAAAVSSKSNKPVKTSRFPWWTLQPLRLFLTGVRGIFEMRYLWQQELNLDDTKLQQTLNHNVPHTPLSVALVESKLI